MAVAQRSVRRLRPSIGKEGETLFIPSKSFVAVAIPGRVNSAATAVRLLGGRHAIESYLASLPTIPPLPASFASSFFSSTAAAPATPDPSTPVPPVLTSTDGLSVSSHASATTSPGVANTCCSLTCSSASRTGADLRFPVASTSASSVLFNAGAAAVAGGSSPSAAAVAPASIPGHSSSSSSPPSSGGVPIAPGEEKLFLRFAQDPIYFKYVASTPAPAAGLLLRVRRRRRSGNSIEILGRVVKRHSFEGLADFYYAPSSPARAALDLRCLLFDKEVASGKQREDEQQDIFHRYSPCGGPSPSGFAESQSCFLHSGGTADASSSSPASVGVIASSSPIASSFRGVPTFSRSRHQVLPFIPPPVFCRFTQPAKQNVFDVLVGDEPHAAGSGAAVRHETTAAAVPASASRAVPPVPVTKEYGTSAPSYHAAAAVSLAAVAAAAPATAPPSRGVTASFHPVRHLPLATTLAPNAPLAEDFAAAASSTSVMTATGDGFTASERLRQQRLRAIGENEKPLSFDYDHSQLAAVAPAGSTASDEPTVSRAAAPFESTRIAATPPVAGTSSAPLYAGTAVAGDAAAGAAAAGAAAAGAAAAGAGAAAAANTCAAAHAAVPLIIHSQEGAAADTPSPSVTEALPIAAAPDLPSSVRVPGVLELQRQQQGQKQVQQQQQVAEKRYSLRRAAAMEEGSDAGFATEGESEVVNSKKKQQQQQGREDQVGRGDEVTAAETEMLWLSSKKSGEEFNAVCRYGDPSVPLVPPAAAARAAADEGLLLLLQQQLQQQPVWLRSSLDVLLPPEFSAWRRKPAYAKTCFLFADGPWRGCLCKFGYDPRSSAASRFYQTIDFRDSFFRTTNWRRSKEREDSSIGSAAAPAAAAATRRVPLLSSPRGRKNEEGVSATFGRGEEEGVSLLLRQTGSSPALLEQHFLLPPSRPSVLYQLKEIRDDAVQKLLHDAPILPFPCKETGWFSASTMKTLRELLAIKSERMRKSGST